MIKFFTLFLFLFIFYYCFLSNSDYVNCSKIIRMQVMSILNKKCERSISDIFAFIKIYIIPLIFSFLISLEDIISHNFYDNIVLILTILVSVFLTLITILTSKSYRNKSAKQRKIIKYTFTNIYFLTIISLILLVMCFLKICIPDMHNYLSDVFTILTMILTKKMCKIIFNFIAIYLLIEIFIHLLIVLKRIEQIFLLTFDD